MLGGAYVTERMMPGVVYMDHGARYDPIVTGELDRGGAINTITPHNITSKNATGMVVSSFLVEVGRADLEQLKKQYPEAFSRPYHLDAGLRMERVVAGRQPGDGYSGALISDFIARRYSLIIPWPYSPVPARE